MNREAQATTCVCSECETAIECCEVCDDEPCTEAVCYRCLNLAMGQMVPDPHPHGG
jgi:hypothetical protein